MSSDLAENPTITDENDPLARPAWACVLHSPPKRVGAWIPADSGYTTCSGCDTGLRERLDDVGARYLQLDSRLGATGGYGSRGAPGFASRPPCNLHVVSLRDPRSSADAKAWVAGDGRVHRESQRPPLSVYGVLSCVGWQIAEHQGVTGPDDRADVYGLLRWIDNNITYAARHAELVLELDAAARSLLGQLRPVTGDARRRIGTCPGEVTAGCAHCGCASTQHDNDGDPRRCNVAYCDCPGFAVPTESASTICAAPLYAPLNGSDVIVCGACHARWERADWLRLGDLLMHAEPVDPAPGQANDQDNSAHPAA